MKKRVMAILLSMFLLFSVTPSMVFAATGHQISVKIYKVVLDSSKPLGYQNPVLVNTITVTCTDGTSHSGYNHFVPLKNFHPTKVGLSTTDWVGYQFNGYYSGGKGSATFTAYTSSNVNATANVTGSQPYPCSKNMYLIYSEPEPVTYGLTVKTVVDGTTVSTVGKGSYASGNVVSVSPDKSGFDTTNYNYTFQGWSRESGAGSFASTSSESTTFTTGAAATVLVARYTRTEKVIDYNLTVIDGTGSGVYASGSKATIKAVAPVETGWVYVFQNWTQTKGQAGTFANANSAETQFTMPKSDATVKANFVKKADTNHNGKPDDEEDKYTVHYDANGGEGTVPADADYLEGIEVTVAAGVTKTDYVFKGWSDGEKTYQPNGKFEMPAKDVTLTAVWADDKNNNGKPDDEEDKYTVHYDANGGEGTVPADADYLEGIEVTVAAGVTKTDYVFKGWSDGEKTYQPNDKFEMPAKDVTLTAVFEEEQDGDDPVSSDVSDPDEDISDPNLPLGGDDNNSKGDSSDANGDEDISDPDVPMNDAPKTGDAFPWMILAAGMVSLGALLVVTKKTIRSH